jgi:hypothetical protein
MANTENERSDGIVNLVEQGTDLRAVIEIIGCQRRRDDAARVGIDTDVAVCATTGASLHRLRPAFPIRVTISLSIAAGVAKFSRTNPA